MTFEERMAELGVDLSDLPKNLAGGPEPYPLSMLSKANGAAWNWYLDIGSDMENYDSTRSKMVLKLYILHLTDIIDRMETRIENLVNLHKRNAHIVANTDPPEGVTVEQFRACVDAIYESFEKYTSDLEPWDDWRADDA